MSSINHNSHDVLDSREPALVYVLCEEHDDETGVTDFNILAVSHDQEALKALLQAKIEKDEYGLIAENGIWDSCDNYFETNYDGCYVKYYILNQDLLSREQALDLLDSEEFKTFMQYPHNLRDIFRSKLAEIMEGQGFYSYNAEVAADHILSDKNFQAIVKTCWWGSQSQLQGDNIGYAEAMLGCYLTNRLCEDQDWFVTVGAAEYPHYPSNLIDIVTDAVYDIAKDCQLPVYDARKTAEHIMRRDDFRIAFEALRDTEYLPEASPEYKHAAQLCASYMNTAAKNEIESQKVNLEALLENAVQRQSTQAHVQTPIHETARL